MFHENFELFPKDNDPAAEWLPDETIIRYYMPHIYSIEDFIATNVHEWLHGLIEWATNDSDSDKEHYIIRELNYDTTRGL